MTVIIIILVGFCAFLAGYIMADSKVEVKTFDETEKNADNDNLKLMEEYRNFLNYNGDEQ